MLKICQMRAHRRLTKMAMKLEDQEIIIKAVEDAEDKQRGASQVLMAESEHKNQGKKTEVLSSSHREQVLFN